MKRFCIQLIFLVLLPLASYAQRKVRYVYDAVGNRIKREIVLSSTPPKQSRQMSEKEENPLSDMLSEHTIKIYPNPTHGALKVSIHGLQDSDKCELGVYTTQGLRILESKVTRNDVDIDLSGKPAGIYFLIVSINGRSTTWKIILK